jgi:hypothetical protein
VASDFVVAVVVILFLNMFKNRLNLESPHVKNFLNVFNFDDEPSSTRGQTSNGKCPRPAGGPAGVVK